MSVEPIWYVGAWWYSSQPWDLAPGKEGGRGGKEEEGTDTTEPDLDGLLRVCCQFCFDALGKVRGLLVRVEWQREEKAKGKGRTHDRLDPRRRVQHEFRPREARGVQHLGEDFVVRDRLVVAPCCSVWMGEGYVCQRGLEGGGRAKGKGVTDRGDGLSVEDRDAEGVYAPDGELVRPGEGDGV